jgi:RNA polymerase sigma-B factor
MTPHWHAGAVRERPASDLSALLRRCSSGDAQARETVIMRFLPLARRVARDYEGRGEPIEDLCQVASVGLIKAVNRYSADRGAAFPAYARAVIVGEIKRHFRDATWRVHVPRSTKECAGRVLRAQRELGVGSAKPEAIANYLGVGREEVGEALCALEAYSPASLDACASTPDGPAPPRHEVIGADDSDYERVEVSAGIRQTLLTLKPRDQTVVLLRLARELTQEEIAGRVGLSQMHVSRILRNVGAMLAASSGLAVGTRTRTRRGSPSTIVRKGTAGLEPATSRV